MTGTRRAGPRARVALLVAALAVTATACTGAASGASEHLRDQYLSVARTAGERAGLEMTDKQWIEVADIVCRRQLITDDDYVEFVREMEEEAPNAALGRVMKDVGRTAISLFCPR